MMLNMFSIFDPSTKIFSLNWLSIMMIMVMLPQLFWLKTSRLSFGFKLLMMNLTKEFSVVMKNNFNLSNLIYLNVLFLFIMMNNLMGLFPYIFTGTSHLIFSLLFSMSMWFSIILFMILKNLKFMLIHFVPLGTPFVLMFFMVYIEFLSNLIRPLTLSIRLVANMIAGHMLLSLIGFFLNKLLYFYIFMLIIQILLLILEIMVSLIQAYVFSVLMVLYLKESN